MAAAVRVLFVCMGNICRSPTAQGVFTRLVEEAGLGKQIAIDSAGTHSYHVGHPPDARARDAASRRGFSLEKLRARRLAKKDFERFDYLIAMDEANRADMLSMSPRKSSDKVHLFLEFAPELDVSEVPDPYYGGAVGFELVLDLTEVAARRLLERIRAEHRL